MNTSESRSPKQHRPAMMRRSTRLIAAVAAGIMGISMVGLTALPASADTKPTDPASPASPVTASPDVLPTVQIDGVVWQQTVVGNTVYAVGQFSTARPAGAAPGVNTTPRNNILAFDIRTGALITSFNASLNAQARSVTASPDGKRIYVGGAFTQVNGVDRRYVAALDAATGALITSFAPLVNSRVNAIVATPDAVYLGGWFTGVGSSKRDKVASFNAANGALLPWNPVIAGGDVTSMVISPDRTKVVAGGNFTSVNGIANAGWSAISTSTSAALPWAVNANINNSGTGAAITSLTSDANYVYASGYDFNGVATAFEGIAAARWSDGTLNWLEDCHGDTYALWASTDVVYSAGHAHYCGNVGGFPETNPRSYNHALAFGKTPTGTITRDTQGYRNFEGTPRSELLNWWPTFTVGSFTNQYQATWSVTGNADYVVMGGEFPTVSGVKQQGLVRFGVGDKSTNSKAPEKAGRAANPTVTSVKSGEVRISWASNWDRDNKSLTYRVYRDGNLTAPIHEKTADSTFWNMPTLNFFDKGLEPGSKHTYRVFARDAYGNESRSESVEVTVASAASFGPYAVAVQNDGASAFWRFGEPTGTTATDYIGLDDLTVGAGVTRGAEGAIAQDTDKSSTFNGTDSGSAAGRSPMTAPNTYTSEAWIKTTTTSGGKIIGFGAAQTGNSSSYDRQTYMDNEGRIWFGVYPNAVRTLNSTKSYNDGEWHHVVSTLGPAGMSLYVDGVLIGKRADTTGGEAYQGVWRIGGDNLGGWPNQPASNYFNGTIDEVAIYPTELTRSQIESHFTASGREVTGPKKPADTYGAAIFDAEPDLFWRLNESNGTTAADSSRAGSTGTYVSGTTLGRGGALKDVADKAVQFDGTSGLLSSNTRFDNPTTYSQELWFNTTTTNGGKLIGFGDNATGLSGSYDRHVYMENDGRLTFGTYTGELNLAQSNSAYNDGEWHHMVATQSNAGMVLYVDGEVVGTNPQISAQGYSGYWKVGSDNTWGPQPYFAGTIDEVAVYSRALPAAEVADHYRLGGGQVTAPPVPNKAPVAASTVTTKDLAVTADGSASSDADGTVASYSWNFGDNSEAVTGATASHTYAAAGTYQVVLTVTDDKGATNTETKPVTVTAPPVPNKAPVAASTLTAQVLAVTADGSASSDADGTVASYSWNFGDNSEAVTGATASHTYAAAGTYQVVLTVTDDKGATNTVTKPVTVTAPPVPNKAPVAAATVSAQDLSVTADGSASSDADGTVASYSWNFGDNTAAQTGATTSHTYATAGTYQVVLTVTDDKGATNTVTKPVTVTAPPAAQPVVAKDLFERTVANGWGASETGGPWTIASWAAAKYAVGTGAGSISTSAGATLTAQLNSTSVLNSTTTTNLSVDKVADGGGLQFSVINRRVAGAGEYRAKALLQRTGAVTIELKKKVGSTESLMTARAVSGLTFAAGDVLTMKVATAGAGSTTVSAKIWKAGTPEPAAWQAVATDATAALQAPGSVGIETYVSGSATNGPISLRLADFLTIREP